MPHARMLVCVDTQFLTTSKAAIALAVSEATVKAMEKRGELPAVRTSSGVRLFRKSDIEQAVVDRAARIEARSK
jgi:excisionase family DNA binding protein